MEEPMLTFEQIVDLAHRLSQLEKMQLIGQLAPDLEAALQTAKTASPSRRRSLLGLLRGCNIGADDIDTARREMWGTFPREDF